MRASFEGVSHHFCKSSDGFISVSQGLVVECLGAHLAFGL